MKKLATVFVFAAMLSACSFTPKDACDKLNDKCASKSGFTKQDCSKTQSDYDKATADQKKQTDTIVTCIDKAADCDAIIKCAMSAAATTSTK